MKIRSIIVISFLGIAGCASFKELKPTPEIISTEGQFTNLKNGDANFKLQKEEKYFVRFPRPEKSDFYLLLVGKTKPLFHSYLRSFFDVEAETLLTRSFGYTEGSVQIISDKNPENDSLIIYPVDSASSSYSWIIDTVKEDLDLAFRYRYVQQWRYTFENEFDRLQMIWEKNLCDRTNYNAINIEYPTDQLDYPRLIALLTPTKSNLEKMNVDLKKLDQVFPQEIKQSSDTAYAIYLNFCREVDDELLVQRNYLDFLTILKKEKDTRGNIVAFLQSAPDFIRYISEAKKTPERIVEKVRRVLTARFDEIAPFYDAALKKTDINAIGPFPELANLENLYKSCESEMPDDLANLVLFAEKFSEERDALKAVESNLADLNAMAENVVEVPTASFYRTALSILQQAQNNLPESEVRDIEKYGKYKCAVTLDQKITNIAKYVSTITEQMKALQVLDRNLQQINEAFEKNITWPVDSFYTVLLNHVDVMKENLPKITMGKIDPYSDSKAAQWVSQRIANRGKQANDLRQKYQKAGEIVHQINAYKIQGNYRGIIKVLNANRPMEFLVAQYPDIDTLSLGTQVRAIANSLARNLWAASESKINDLFLDRDYVNLDAILERKNQSVRLFEAELFQRVELTSRTAAETFIRTRELTVMNVPSLYKDSSFLPVYKLTFTSTNQKDLQKKRKQIEDYLAEMKNIRFPETAIKALYQELIKNILDQGVEKARAIVDHGKFYKGKDRQISGLVDECDCTVPKEVTRPSEYRKFFILPTTSNKKGNNDYILRLSLAIPSEAEFPIFDVNITVPPELAQNAEKKAWFNEININKKVIKNEGRFHITAPIPSNNFESQVSPVQLDKGNTNIFEIKLKYPGFRVFEVSTMVQKPIMRRN